MNNPQYIIVHTEASPTITDKPKFLIVNEEHKQRDFTKSSLGWYVGYHYFIEKTGELKQARKDTDGGCHTKGYNLVSLGICCAGNGDVEIPNQAQQKTLKKFLLEKTKQYNILRNKIEPHRNFLLHHEKTCYGSLLSDDWAQKLLDEALQEQINELIKNSSMIINSEINMEKKVGILEQVINLLKTFLKLI